ncbi:MAG: hypothetical protein ACKV2U_19685 [Bryobacteraceae bacterium]
MASTTLCDYQVLRGSSFTLNAATNETELTLFFEVPDDFEFGTSARRPILAFLMHPREDCRFTIFLNAREIFELSFDQGNTRGIWKAFSATTAFPEGASFPNPAPLRIFVNEGRVTFSDVVMWYQIKRNE